MGAQHHEHGAVQQKEHHDMTPKQRDITRKLSPPSTSRLTEALRKKYKTPRACLEALGLDASLLAFDQALPTKRFSKARAIARMMKQGCSEQECDEFLDYLASGEAEAEDDHATSEVHNKMEAAAHAKSTGGDMPGLPPDMRISGSVDRLPEYRNGSGMPMNSIDALFPPSPAHAPIVDLPIVDLGYENYAKSAQSLLNEIAVAQGLTAKEMVVAESVAGAWVYVGPCRGKIADRDRALVAEQLYFASVPHPQRPLHAAVLQMIAIMNLDGMGAGTERACKFAFSKSGMKGPQ
jgi:hypothetical protein